MARQILVLALMSLLTIGAAPAEADPATVTGQWYGTFTADFPIGRWASPEFPTGSTLEMVALPDGSGQYWAVLYIPDLGLLDVPVPMILAGNQVAIGDPQFAWGTIVDDALTGVAVVPDPLNPSSFLFIEWQAQREITALPGALPGTTCAGLPPLFCAGDAEHCRELVQFSPAAGQGVLDYLVKDETWDDQYRSHVRRDLMQAVTYAAAKVKCRTGDWNYGNGAPVGLGDMSDADGLAPTTNGLPDHLTHEDGNHVDIAYYQLYAPDNLLRAVGRHHDGYFDDYHLTEPPYALDAWRTALFVAYLSEHPHLRFILVDGQVGLMLEDALFQLESLGWIEAGRREKIPLRYQVTDESSTYFFHHHDHMHVTMAPLHPIVSNMELKPSTLNKRSRGRFITGRIEFVEGHAAADIELASVALIVDGHTLVYAEPGHSRVSDSNGNGVADLTVKFDRKAVTQAIGTGTVEMAIIGSVDGLAFQASDTVRAISP